MCESILLTLVSVILSVTSVCVYVCVNIQQNFPNV